MSAKLSLRLILRIRGRKFQLKKKKLKNGQEKIKLKKAGKRAWLPKGPARKDLKLP